MAATSSAAPRSSCPVTEPGQWLDPGPFGCLGVGAVLRHCFQAAPSRPASATDRGRWRLRLETDGEGDGGALRSCR
jgi:hypothetical protein